LLEKTLYDPKFDIDSSSEFFVAVEILPGFPEHFLKTFKKKYIYEEIVGNSLWW
jgi:hypothetical protein